MEYNFVFVKIVSLFFLTDENFTTVLHFTLRLTHLQIFPKKVSSFF